MKTEPPWRRRLSREHYGNLDCELQRLAVRRAQVRLWRSWHRDPILFCHCETRNQLSRSNTKSLQESARKVGGPTPVLIVVYW